MVLRLARSLASIHSHRGGDLGRFGCALMDAFAKLTPQDPDDVERCPRASSAAASSPMAAAVTPDVPETHPVLVPDAPLVTEPASAPAVALFMDQLDRNIAETTAQFVSDTRALSGPSPDSRGRLNRWVRVRAMLNDILRINGVVLQQDIVRVLSEHIDGGS